VFTNNLSPGSVNVTCIGLSPD